MQLPELLLAVVPLGTRPATWSWFSMTALAMLVVAPVTIPARQPSRAAPSIVFFT